MELTAGAETSDSLNNPQIRHTYLWRIPQLRTGINLPFLQHRIIEPKQNITSYFSVNNNKNCEEREN